MLGGLRLLAFAAAGLVLTLAVAWGVQNQTRVWSASDRSIKVRETIDGVRIGAVRTSTPSWEIWSVWCETWRRPVPWEAVNEGLHRLRGAVPGWIAIPEPDQVGLGFWFGPNLYTAAFGFPFRAVRFRQFSSLPTGALGGVPLSSSPSAGLLRLRTTPTRVLEFAYQPVWPGLLLNTAFYGLVASGLWYGIKLGFVWARGALRRRADCCPGCGYPRAGLEDEPMCPECGMGAEG